MGGMTICETCSGTKVREIEIHGQRIGGAPCPDCQAPSRWAMLRRVGAGLGIILEFAFAFYVVGEFISLMVTPSVAAFGRATAGFMFGFVAAIAWMVGLYLLMEVVKE